MEQTANNNPSSATAQNAFYSALLRANMPAIVVERYQTGRYATNAASQDTYQRALERIGSGDAAMGSAGASQLHGTSAHSTLSSGQLQAIGQAMAAHQSGGNVSSASTNASAGTKKDSPLYVVVGESRGFAIFKWVKFVVQYSFLIWVTLILIMVFVEMTGVLKKVGFSQFNEAQPQQQKARFADVHGCDEAKEELQELVEFLKDPKKFSTLGGKLPKGVLLVGPPGTGKTLLARAVAGEAGVPFFFMSGSEFDEVYVGVGAKRIRELFNAARGKAPAIVFIDELDAVGGKRNERDAAYVKQTLNQLLTELDGFTQDTGVIIIGATNFPQLLDKALTRPGRFDRHVVVPLPDVRGRMEILRHHMKKIKAEVNVDPSTIARQTPGFSGADLENLINQAAVRASRNKQKFVTLLDFDWAKDRILMGAERRSAVIQQKDRVMTAYHEGGHALVALFTEAADPLYKATIMPRGQALGMTSQLPEMDQVSMSKRQCLARIDVCMGGKVAEEMIYGPENTTTGASSVSSPPFPSHYVACTSMPIATRPFIDADCFPQDIQQATRIAQMMVTQVGFSDTLGDVDLDSTYNRLSATTKMEVEREVRRIIDDSRARAQKILTERRAELERLATALVEYEVLDLEEIQKVVKGEKLAKMSMNAKPGPGPGDGSGGKDEGLKGLTLPPIKLPPLPGGSAPSQGEGEKAGGGVPARPVEPEGHGDPGDKKGEQVKEGQ